MSQAEKSCGSCNLCCKVVEVESLAKPAGTWCVHTGPGKVCGIHGSHPWDCRKFACGWLQRPEIPDNWKPDACHFILRSQMDGQRLAIDVDSDFPDAWRAEPFHGRIKQLSQAIWHDAGYVVVYVAAQVIAIFPEEDLDLGDYAAGDSLSLGYEYQGARRKPVVQIQSAGGASRTVVGTAFRDIPASDASSAVQG